MPPRPYNNDTRLAQQAELKARIAEAAARLHRAQGALATSYAEIAREAGVSLPTVYKHFPTLDELVTACSGHVASQAPAFPQQAILEAADLRAAARALVDAMDALHAHFAPWRAWREENRIPVLARQAAEHHAQLTALCQAVLQRHLGVGDHAHAAAWWESLLGFDLREHLLNEHALDRATYRAHLVQLLLAVAGPQPAAPPSRPKPPRKAP